MNNIEENITIIIPARKIDYLLEEFIKNIRNLYKEVKIILVLDEYDDNETGFNKVKILKSDNINMSAKRNKGVYASDTKYTAFIDSDAYPCENWLEEGIKFLECNNDYTAVTGNQILPDNSSFMQKYLRQVRFNHLFCHDEWGKVIDTNASEQDISEFMTSNAIIRRKDYIDLKGMNENIYLAEDNEFSLRLIKNGYKIRFIPKVKVYHHECCFYPFMRKIYSMGYYYSNMFIKGKRVKPLKQTIEQFLPLYGIILFILLIMLFIYIKRKLIRY